MANNTFQKIYSVTSGYTNINEKDLILLYSKSDKEVKSVELSSAFPTILSNNQTNILNTNLDEIQNKLK